MRSGVASAYGAAAGHVDWNDVVMSHEHTDDGDTSRPADRQGHPDHHDHHGHPDHHDHHDRGRHHHRHGHENDQGIKGALRYLRWLPQMWRSEINDAVVDAVDPQPGERVVDIGAGLGAGATRAAAAGAHVVAVEPTPFMRRALRLRRLAGRQRSNLEVVDGSAEQIPVADRSADVVVAVNTMHHWIDVDRGVAEIARVLRPGGRVLLVDEDFTDPSHPEHDRFGAPDEDGHHHGFTLVDAGEMGERLSTVGLVDVDASRRELAARPSIVVSALAPEIG